MHRRRIYTEEKAKVVAPVLGLEFIHLDEKQKTKNLCNKFEVDEN